MIYKNGFTEKLGNLELRPGVIYKNGSTKKGENLDLCPGMIYKNGSTEKLGNLELHHFSLAGQNSPVRPVLKPAQMESGIIPGLGIYFASSGEHHLWYPIYKKKNKNSLLLKLF